MFSKITYFLVVCLAGAPLFGAETSPDAAQLVNRMGDSRLTQDQRNAAAGSLVGLGKPAMPVLINSLHDNRVFCPNYEAPSGINGGTFTIDLTVGLECDYILTDIVSKGESTKPFGFRYKVFNWPAWWRKHKDMSQPEIQKEANRFNQWIIESTGQGDSIPHINQP